MRRGNLWLIVFKSTRKDNAKIVLLDSALTVSKYPEVLPCTAIMTIGEFSIDIEFFKHS